MRGQRRPSEEKISVSSEECQGHNLQGKRLPQVDGLNLPLLVLGVCVFTEERSVERFPDFFFDVGIERNILEGLWSPMSARK